MQGWLEQVLLSLPEVVLLLAVVIPNELKTFKSPLNSKSPSHILRERKVRHINKDTTLSFSILTYLTKVSLSSGWTIANNSDWFAFSFQLVALTNSTRETLARNCNKRHDVTKLALLRCIANIKLHVVVELNF